MVTPSPPPPPPPPPSTPVSFKRTKAQHTALARDQERLLHATTQCNATIAKALRVAVLDRHHHPANSETVSGGGGGGESAVNPLAEGYEPLRACQGALPAGGDSWPPAPPLLISQGAVSLRVDELRRRRQSIRLDLWLVERQGGRKLPSTHGQTCQALQAGGVALRGIESSSDRAARLRLLSLCAQTAPRPFPPSLAMAATPTARSLHSAFSRVAQAEK
jgi:hypothetical protein